MQAHQLLAGHRIPAGLSHSTVMPDLDFETYSEAGFVWKEDGQKWVSLAGPGKKGGLPVVGAAVYAEHPSTEILELAYNLKDGTGPKLWRAGDPPPLDLFNHITTGGLLEAWNCGFEWHIWNKVAHERMGWPALPIEQLRDAMAKSRAWALPGALGKAAEVLGTSDQKMTEGMRLIKKFSVPRKPTKKDTRKRIRPSEDPVDGPLFGEYCLGDIAAESAVSALVPDLNPVELEFWLNTMRCNLHGIALDMPSVNACVDILEQVYARYNLELCQLTMGQVTEATKRQALLDWCAAQGYPLRTLDADALEAALARTDLPPHVYRALEIRHQTSSAGVKKVYAMQQQANRDGRACDLFIYHGARTGRDTGAAIQPQNLVKQGVKLKHCGSATCNRYYGAHLAACPFCLTSDEYADTSGWSWEATDDVLEAVRTRSLDYVESIFGEAVLAISGCIRGLFVAGPGKDFICSDYSSIEAVVTAMLSGEQWRIDAFHRKEDIYLVSAGRITGRTLAEYDAYKQETGNKHPDRQKIGKPAELGLGFGGWLNAWRQFDSTDTFTDEQVKQNIQAWRAASPMVVEMWGGQVRGKPWAPDSVEYYGLEGAAIMAIQNPGQCYSYRDITYGVKDDVLYCKLPSGRSLTYHQPRLVPSAQWEGQLSIQFMGWNSNPQMGPMGWVPMNTYGGRLFENVVQAVARDIMAHGVNLAERANYPIRLRVHDEIVAEVPKGWGSVEILEQIMGTMPDWAQGWPIRASGGWRGHRFRKD